METNRRTLTFLLFFLALLFGTLVRVMPVLQAGFPLNDGGLFYSMTSDLQKANYALPAVTTYNGLDIPYAYPSLPFYLAAFLRNITGAQLIDIIRWLPVFFSLLTIPAFFLLARALLENEIAAGVATLIFSLLPCSYEWVIMGGGITRAPASLFLILMIWSAYRLFRNGGWKMVLMTIFSASMVILSHPERSLHAVATAVVLFLYFGRSREGLKRAALVIAGVLIVTSPWWISVLIRYGWTPFSLAFSAGGNRWIFWSPLLLLNFTDETIAIAALLAVVGVAACLKQKKTFLPVWLVLTFLADPRSAHHVIAIHTSLLAALGMTEVIFPALSRLGNQSAEPKDNEVFLSSRMGKWVFGYFLLILLMNAVISTQQIGGYVLSKPDQAAMEWVQSSTLPASRFVVLADQTTPGLSPQQEWFPALSERTSISTSQGREWLPGLQNYRARIGAYPALRDCLWKDYQCVEAWAAQQEDTFDYVYLSLSPSRGDPPKSSLLAASLMGSSDYQVVYQTTGVLIFARH